jgi:cytochrome c oxidase subunit 2
MNPAQLEEQTRVTHNRHSLPGKRLSSARSAAGAACLSLVLAGCANAPSIVDPQGPAAREIANLWWILLALATVVFLGVVGYLWVALTRRMEPEPDDDLNPRRGIRIVVVAGIIIPAIILLATLGFTINTLRVLATPEIPEEMVIEVIGHQWWWEVRYPHHEIVTANEIHIPAGRPVQIVLQSDDVIHSFWVPELHGKLDMVPGETNEFWIQADQPGVYWGECAEFCGIQHAKMQFVVVAKPMDAYEAWIDQQRQPAAVPSDPLAQQGADVFLRSGCLDCHRISGTQATGRLGPDLTHLAGRRTLGAGSTPNTLGHLSGWITDPQGVKPGALMPATDLTGTDLQALLAYLTTLE